MQPKNKPVKRRQYDATFKADVLKMIANGQRVAYVAQALGISEVYIVKRKRTDAGEKKRDTFKHFELAEKYDFSAVGLEISEA